MRYVDYETEEQRRELMREAKALGEQKYRDDTRPNGSRFLTFRPNQAEWVSYFRSIMPEGLALEETPLDMAVARVFHMNQIRIVRDAELRRLDISFIRAVEDADTDAQATIKTEKQTLRDIPATFDITTDAGTPELLRAKWPAELPDRE